MSSLHLGSGSDQPPKSDGKIRLYSMKYCPFSHRVRLALSLKKIPHDIVNINLKSKPEWYSQVHPEGKVPALLNTDGEVITDSVVIVNYLDEKYPNQPLYKKETLTRDIELLEYFDKVVKVFSGVIHKKDNRPLAEVIDEIYTYLIVYEDELTKRNTTYFSGDKPGMLDILMWPFFERAKALSVIHKEELHFAKDKFPKLADWISGMKNQDFVQENYVPHETFAKVVEASNAGSVDYDNI